MKTLYGNELVNELRSKSDSIKKRLWIAVPFIGGLKSVRRIIGRIWIDNPDISVRLLTDTNEFNNFNSDTIKQFYEIGEIRHLKGLHAKIYITDNSCLLTSANLTNKAFTQRHEIGIFLDDGNASKSISIFESWWKKSEKVSLDSLQPIITKKHISNEERIGSDLPAIWNLPNEPDEITYWLKPIGVANDPITEQRFFNDPIEYLHFATPSKTPRININDIIIAYGVGAKRILSIYAVTTLPSRVTKKEIAKNKQLARWPWFVEGKNITPKFGASWQQHNLYASELVEEFLKTNPRKFITKVKSKSLNALMRGKDKIKLDPEFAKFVIQKIKNIESSS